MKFKRTISAFSAAVMLGTCGWAVPLAQAADTEPVIKVTFDDGSDAYELQNGAALAAGRSGNALSLDGVDDYATINSIADTFATLGSDFTISVWCNPNAITTWSRIYDFGNGSSGTYVFLTPSSASYPRLAVTTNGTAGEQQVDADTMLTVGAWHNITITRTGGTTAFYIDGYSAGSTTALRYNFNEIGVMQNYYLGKSQFEADPYFSGLIDDFEVYNYALSESEIQTLAAEAYTSKKNAQIYENNCFVVDTHFYDSTGEIFAYNTADAPVDTSLSTSNISINENAVSFTLHNGTQNNVSALSAYAASYDENGTLIQLAKKDFTEAEITSDAYDVSIPFETINRTRLFVWNGMTPVKNTDAEAFAVASDGTITAVSTIENDTTESGELLVSLTSVASDGSETKLAQAESFTLASLDSKEVSLSVPENSIPEDVEKLVVKVDTGDEEAYTAASLYCGIVGPQIAPADSNTTTNGAHDPSIVQFPGDDTYYVYSSHHLIFTSKDLINWTKYDFTNIDASKISPKTASFISSNYANTTMNGTYWAPDVIYMPEQDPEHPYWMYISLSCGLGGRNSAIALMKSDNPLFWADSSSDIIDAGVVFATKEESGYITNAIDANIYTDTDGTMYFIWGSFWGGIQTAPMTADGFVQGIDYTSDSTILSTCKNFGTSIFTQKNGVAGPEGAWMFTNGDYRYLFTSYGWLGSNYNTRIARSPLSTSFAVNTGTQLVDANGVIMGTQYDKGSTSSPSGYKLIGSYRLGDGSMTVTNDGADYYVPRGSEDAHIYYGPGHNSAITAANGESFYCSHIRKDAVEGAAVLQIRKMLCTEDGWPVVSPVTYAGEVEQALPEEMLYGTYDLASVGRTKMDGESITASGSLINRNYDLPVLSSKITLNEDGTMADGLGTWTFDGDHTITLTFAKNGDTSKDEFYQSGDVMTMYALYGYDKDEKEPVIALTGTDQNHITQLAKKSMTLTYKTPAKTVEETQTISIAKSAGGNPELGFDADGNILYGGDPAATVIDTDGDGEGDTVYLIVGHDTATAEAYVMPEWVLYTSTNMTDWEYKGVIMKATDISWRSDNTSAWASQMTPYTDADGNTKYYFYFCTWDKTSGGKQSIGVAVADNPEGPYTDALGVPLVAGTFTEPETSGWNDIDPTVLIDTDEDGIEHRYLAWGNGKYYVCELNEDMISVKDLNGDGVITMNVDIKERTIKGMNGGVYTEAPWLYKRDGKYYLFYAMNWREEMAYAMADDPLGRYDFKQIIMPPTATSNTNHPSVIDFNGKTYFIYHNGALPHGSGFRRSVCIDELEFDENGYVYPVTETSIGLTGTASTIITSDGGYVGHSKFTNSLADASYPLSTAVTVTDSEDGYNTAWELMQPKSVPEGEDSEYYVSIQSVNKPGLYIASTGTGVVLTQDSDGLQGAKMTFKTIKGLDGKENTVSFQSVSDPTKYLTVLGTTLTLSFGTTVADCSFTIGEAIQKDVTTINIADIEPEPDPEPDVASDFNDAEVGTVISVTDTVQTSTQYPGADLYIGGRSGGASGTTWAIEAGVGVDGTNALVMNSARFTSSNRGPRVQITTPAIPNGYTVTGQFQVKLGTNGELYYNDSTAAQATTAVPGVSTTDWATVKVIITNDNDTYTRTMYVDDELIFTDYVNVFPVFWGISQDSSTVVKVYFDNFSVKTTTASGEAPVITVPEPVAEYKFDGNLKDELSEDEAELTGSLATDAATVAEAVYNDSEDGQAVVFEGSGSYGLKIPYKLKSGNYTISFDAKLNTSAIYSPFVFIANFDGTTLKGGEDNAQWISISPQGWQETLTNGPMIWSRDVTGGSAWNDLYTASNNSMALDKWQNITVVASGTSGTIYVDGVKVADGTIAGIIDDTTTIYLGVNAWDTPLDGAIDNFRIYNKALSASQVKQINE